MERVMSVQIDSATGGVWNICIRVAMLLTSIWHVMS